MATYKNNGEVELTLPSLVLTVKPGDTFEAPAGLEHDNIVLVASKTPKPDTTVGA